MKKMSMKIPMKKSMPRREEKLEKNSDSKMGRKGMGMMKKSQRVPPKMRGEY